MVTWKRSRPVFQELQDVSRHTIVINRSLIAAMGAMGALCLLVPVAYNRLPKAISGAMLATSAINLVGMGVLARAAIDAEKIWASNIAAQRHAFKVSRENQLKMELTRHDLYTKEELMEMFKSIPADWRDHFASEYGLVPLLPVPEPASAPPPPKPATLVAPSQSYTDTLINPAQEEDTTWLDVSFFDSHKVVFGNRGSGKSTFLRAEAASFLSAHPGGILIICDLHFDMDDEKESSWMRGMPMEEQLKFVADTPAKVLDAFRRFGSEIRDRVGKKDKSRPPVKLICDEFNGFIESRCSEDEAAEVLDIVQFFTYECRKFNRSAEGTDVGMTFGIHNLKKGGCGIDSSILANMNILVLGDMLNDPNLNKSLPGNFNCTELEKAREELQRNLTEGYWACVVRIQGIRPGVEALPDLKAYALSFEIAPATYTETVEVKASVEEDVWDDDPGDPMELLKEWYKCQDPEPTDAELLGQYQQVTGTNLNEKGLQYLRDPLRKS